MKVQRTSWHYNIAHFASTKLEQEIHTRGGYYGRVARGIFNLISLLTLVVSLVLGPTLLISITGGHLSFLNIPITILIIGCLGLFFDALIIGGTFIFVTVIVLSAVNVYVLSPITKWLNERQGRGMLSKYMMASLSDRVKYEDTKDDNVDMG